MTERHPKSPQVLTSGSLEYNPLPGDTIESACAEAKRIAEAVGGAVVLVFNDRRIAAHSDTSVGEMVRAYWRKESDND